MVGATGFEPVTTRTPSVCATRLRYAPTWAFTYGLCNTPGVLNQFISSATHKGRISWRTPRVFTIRSKDLNTCKGTARL